MIMIDAPDAMAPLADWQKYETTLQGLIAENPNDEGLRDELEIARFQIRLKSQSDT